jgi:hypothetical protein
MTHVISKATEKYDRGRLTRAVRCAARANRTPIGDAENFAMQVAERIEHWLADKSEITGRELRLQTANVLADYDADAADYYLTEKMLF